MSKKGENIRKRKDGRWEGRYEKGRKPNGKIDYGYVYGKSYHEVRQKKIRAMQEISISLPPDNPITMERLCREWLFSMRGSLKQSSYSCYHTQIEKHIIPWFSVYGTEDISTDIIAKFAAEKSGTGLSGRTIKSLLILLQSILRYGEEQGYLSLRGISIRYPRVEDYALNLISDVQMQRLITCLQEERDCFSTGLLLCIYTGIRVGELSGLQWQDIDFEQGLMHIRRTVSRIRNVNAAERERKTILLIGSPKSLSSVRDIPLPAFLVERMLEFKTKSEYYVLTGTYHCMEPRGIQRRFAALLERCQIPRTNIHSLRHTFATRCTEMGFDSKTLSEILGHSSVKITMDIYVHSNLERKKDCINQLCFEG